MKDIFVAAHPDDIEAMMAHAVVASENPYALVATNGEGSTVDMRGRGFVQAGNRIQESRASLCYIGVPLTDQVYLGLPDGELAEQYDELQQTTVEAVRSIQPGRIFTTGATGYDGHADHIAVHKAAVRAAWELWQAGHETEVWALDAQHNGVLRIGGDTALKTGALALHASQRQTPDLERWGNTDLYTPLIVGVETYSRIPDVLAFP